MNTANGTYSSTAGVGSNIYNFVPGTYFSSPTVDAGGFGAAGAKAATPVAPVEYYGANIDYSGFVDPNAGMGEFRKSLNRGWEQTQALGYGSVGLLGDILGLDEVRDWGFEGYQRNMEEAAQYQAATPGFTDIDSVGSALDWVAGTAGELIPTAVSTIATAGGASILARTVGSKLLRRYAAKEIAQKTAELSAAGFAQDQAKALATKEALANLSRKVGTASMIGFSAGQEAGANWGQDVENHGKANTSPGLDLMFGLASGMSEAIWGADASLWRAVTGRAVKPSVERAFRRELINGLPKAMISEGSQEAFQEILSKINANIQDSKDLVTVDDIEDIFNAAMAGSLGGAGFHMPTLLASRRQRKQDNTKAFEQNASTGVDSITRTTNPLNDPADTRRMQQDLVEARNPWMVARKQEQDYLRGWDEYANEERAKFEQSWNSANAKLLSSFAAIQDKLPRLNELPSNERKNINRILAQHQKYTQEKQKALDALNKRLDKGYTAADGTLITAAKRQVMLDNKRRYEQINAVPALNRVLEDATVYAQKVGNAIDKRITTITSAINELTARMEQDQKSLSLTADKYRRYQAELKKLTNMRAASLRSKRNVVKAVSKITKKASNITQDELGSVGLDVQELYHVGDSALELSRTNDIFREGQATRLEDINDRFEQLKEQVQKAQKRVDALSDEKYGDRKKAVQDVLRNTAISLSGTDLYRDMPLRNFEGPTDTDPVANAREQQEREATDRDTIRSGFDSLKNEMLREQQVLAQQQDIAARNEVIRDNTGQQNVQADPQDTQIKPQEPVRGTENENPTQPLGQQEIEPQKVTSAIEQDKAVAREQELHQSVATSVLSQDQQVRSHLKTVTNWINNTLNTLPSLRDNVVLCVDGNDSVIPLEVHNALDSYTGTPKGVYWNGKVYLFTSNIRNKQDAVRTLVHEGVAHFGLRSIMTDVQLGNFLNLVYNNFNKSAEWKEFVSRRSDAVKNADKVTQAEEFVAYIAEQMKVSQLVRPTTKSIFTRVINFLRNVLSKLGVGSDVTINDIREVIRLSAENLSRTDNDIANSIKEIEVVETLGASVKKPVIEDEVYGIKFLSAAASQGYYKRLEGSRSGNTNTPYILNLPKNSNTLNLNDKLNEQSEQVQARLNKLIQTTGLSVEMIPNQDGTFSAYFGEKEVTSGLNETQANDYLSEGKFINDVTGWDVYNTLTSALGSKRDATVALRDFGIRGAQFAKDGNNSYFLFEGNNIFSKPFEYNLEALSEPKFLITDETKAEDIVVDPVTGELTQKDTADELSYMNALYAEVESQSKGLGKLKEVLKTGKSRDADGNLIEHSLWEKVIEGSVDQYRRLYTVQNYLKKKFPGIINGVTNVYQQLQGMINRIRQAQCKYRNEFFRPAIEALQSIDAPIPVYDKDGNIVRTYKKGDALYEDFLLKMLDDVLVARHAAERNKSVSDRMRGHRYLIKDEDGNVVGTGHTNRKKPSEKDTIINASGMSDAQAARILERYGNFPGLDKAIAHIDRMNKFTLNTMLSNNLITKEAYDRMSKYDFYVPLIGWQEMGEQMFPAYFRSGGRSMSTGGKPVVRTAKGRSGLPESPFLRSVKQMDDILAIAERNEIMRNFGELVKSVNNTEDKNTLFEFDNKNPEAVRLQVLKDGTIGFVTKTTEFQGSGEGAVTYIDNDGSVKRIVIHDKWLAAAMRGENRAPISAYVNTLRKYTGIMTQYMTARNPAFAIVNPIRDLPSAIINIGSSIEENIQRGLLEKTEDIQKGVVKDVVSGKLMKLIWDISKYDTLGTKFDTSKYDAGLVSDLNDWRTYGGHTRMIDEMTVKDMAKSVRKELKEKGPIKSVANKLIDYMDVLSDTTENTTRFAVYRNFMKAFRENLNKRAKEEGWSDARYAEELDITKQKSVNIALECTVNFTRKGAWANAYNPLWAFSSASLQSFARICRNLWRPTSTPQQNFKRVSKFLATGMAFPLMWGTVARAIMGDDDDGINRYDKIPDYVKYRNLIIPMPFSDGGYIKIPLPYGYNVFTAAGTIFDDVIHGNTSATKGSMSLLKIAMNGVSPIDPSEQGILAFVPTLFKPVVEVAANVNFAGAPIMPSGPGTDSLADHMKSWASTPQAYKDAAALINFISGGWITKDGIGMVDISPETIEHITMSYSGGIGRILQQMITLATSPAFGHEVGVKDVPVLNRLYGTTTYKNNNALYNRYNDQVNVAKALMREAEGNPERTRELRDNFRNALSLEKKAQSAITELNKIKQAERALRKRYPQGTKSRAFNAQMELIQKRKEQVMKRFNASAHRAGLTMD
jgi:hypothetical protein